MRTLTLAILLACLPAMGAREFVAASTNECRIDFSLSVTPVTLSCWVRPVAYAADQTVLALTSSTDITPYMLLRLSSADPGKLRVFHRGSTAATEGWAQSTNAVATNQWTHVAGVLASLSARTAFVGGTPGTTDTVAVPGHGTNTQAVVGALRRTTYLQGFNGSIADAAIWNVALTADEVASLAAGASPLTVRPQSLVFYAPLTGESTTTEVNLIGPALSLSNSPARATSHPRIFAP